MATMFKLCYKYLGTVIGDKLTFDPRLDSVWRLVSAHICWELWNLNLDSTIQLTWTPSPLFVSQECIKKAQLVLTHPHRPLNREFKLLPLGRRLIPPRRRTNGIKHSGPSWQLLRWTRVFSLFISFPPLAVRQFVRRGELSLAILPPNLFFLWAKVSNVSFFGFNLNIWYLIGRNSHSRSGK